MTKLEANLKQRGKKLADVNNGFSQALSETTNLVDATGHRLGQAAQRGISETTDRAEEMGRRLTEAAQRGASEATESGGSNGTPTESDSRRNVR